MAGGLPVVCVFGALNVNLSSPECPKFETSALDCRCYLTDDDLSVILARDCPAAIVTFGAPQDFPRLLSAPSDVAKRWVNYANTADLSRVGAEVFRCYLNYCLKARPELPPLVSVFTPTYRTRPECLERAYHSLCRQTHSNWQWVLFDDSGDQGATFGRLQALSQQDHRIRAFQADRHSGIIGQVKRWAAGLCRGEYLVELDHDDELTPNTLTDISAAFKQYDGSTPERPLAGFVYTDFAEVLPDGKPLTYGPNWGFGYGSYRQETFEGRSLMVANAPNVGPKTIRHIVAAPNHARAWRASLYFQIGGHNPLIHVADDYELIVRTFLSTRVVRVPKLCYIQWRNAEGNTHRERNAEIQRLVRSFSQWYEDRIHARFLELSVDDFVWQAGQNTFARLSSVPNPASEPHCTLLV